MLLPLFVICCSTYYENDLNFDIYKLSDLSAEEIVNPDAIAFVTFGDQGIDPSTDVDGVMQGKQAEVGEAIKVFCAKNPCDFVMTAGDNFHWLGVQSVEDPLWDSRYRQIYEGLNIPFYAALGNHDVDGNVEAQIEFSQIDPWWRMPAEYYSITQPEGESNPFLELFVINSETINSDLDQQNWLEESIGRSKARWKLLVVHRPFYSNSDMGDDSGNNNEVLLPIVCNNIDLVLSGHVHLYSYLEVEDAACLIRQVIVGTGGGILNFHALHFDDPRLIQSTPDFGFGWLDVTPTRIKFRFLDINHPSVQ